MRLACVLLTIVVLSNIGFIQGALIDPCNSYRNCSECLYTATRCGWCGSNGKCMTAHPTNPFNGPDVGNYGDCVSVDGNSSHSHRWEYHTSAVWGDNNQTDGILIPTEFYVYVRPGIPVNVTIRLIVPTIPPIDLMVLQDGSYSMIPLINLIESLVPNISQSLRDFTKNSTACRSNVSDCVWFGQYMYLEKPVSPFANFPESYIIKPVTNLSADIVGFQQGLALSPTYVARNYEHPEDGLEAMLFMAQNPEGAGFRYSRGVFHICMLISDAGCHLAGDGKNLGIFTPNNANGRFDGNPPGSGEDYPTLEQVRRGLINSDVSPLFAVSPKVLGFYKAITDQWGFGSTVELSTNSDVVGTILEGTKQILSKAQLTMTDDILGRFVEFAYPKDGIYTGVSGNQELYYIVTVMAPVDFPEAFNKSSDILIKYVGFGNKVTIKTFMNITCIGCIPENATAQVDLCGVCGGGNDCRGCDDIIASGIVFDACGECGGKNDSCKDCEQIVNGNKTYDACGVCGGANLTCLGCDGIPLSGKALSPCGICGGPPNCDEKTVIIALGVTVAIVGLIAAILGILFCCTFGVVIARADKMMLDEESKLQENPLYEAAKKKFDNPLYDPKNE